MNIITRLANYIVMFIGKTNWKQTNPLTDAERDVIRSKLTDDYYIILTRSNNHLSTYAISFANFILSGKFSYWGHALMNFEDSVDTDSDFKLVQATAIGVGYAAFADVFNVNSTVLLVPKNMTIDNWTLVLDKAKTAIGKPYDTLYDLKNDSALSCVELVRNALQADPNYATNFANFEALIIKYKNLTPQMFYDCEDFIKVVEYRH